MGPLAAYSIKSAILLSILLAIYMLTLGRQKDASLRRISLLCICIVSALIPLFYNFGFREDAIQHVIVATGPTPTAISGPIPISMINKIITIIIISGMGIGVILSAIGLARILKLRSRTIYHQGHKLRIIPNGQPSPFCFCGSIYLSEADFSSLPEMILTHESSHIRHLHFIDLIIGRMLLILQWWNPMAWLLVREMQQVHEYQADNDVLKAGYDTKEYQYLLLNRTISDARSGLVSGFKQSALKDRLKMINRENSWRKKVIALLIMLASASFVTFALPRSRMILYINDKFSAISLDSFRQTKVEDKVIPIDGQPHLIIDGTPMPYASINRINPKAIESFTVRKDNPEYPYGVVEIKTKPGSDAYNHNDSREMEEIKVLGVGSIRKE